MSNQPDTSTIVAPEGGAATPETPPGPSSRRRWRAVLAAGAVLALGVTAGTGLIVQTAVEQQEERIAETEALAESVDLDASQLDTHAGILTARAVQEAEQALSGADAAMAEASGKSDAAQLAASVLALRSYELLAPERVFELVEATEAQVAAVRAGIAEFDRIAAERAAAERAAAERAAAEQAAAEAAADAAGRQTSGRTAAPSVPAPPSNPSEAQAIARELMASQYGWGDDQFGCLVAVWNYESGWNVYATNPSSGAYGIPQALPGSKMATAGADWQTSARTQIIWGLGYIAGRYGTPCGAWAHIEANGWY